MSVAGTSALFAVLAGAVKDSCSCTFSAATAKMSNEQVALRDAARMLARTPSPNPAEAAVGRAGAGAGAKEEDEEEEEEDEDEEEEEGAKEEKEEKEEMEEKEEKEDEALCVVPDNFPLVGIIDFQFLSFVLLLTLRRAT